MLFSVKVDNYTDVYPNQRNTKIQANIKSASLPITLTADTTWAGTTTIHF